MNTNFDNLAAPQYYPTDDWPQELLALLGQIVIAYGQLDYVLSLAFKRITGGPFDDTMLLANKDALSKRQRKVLEKLREDGAKRKSCHKAQYDSALVEFETILERIRHCAERRNKIIHSAFSQTVDGDRIRRVIDREANAVETCKIDLSEMTRLRDDMRFWRNRLDEVTREWFLGPTFANRSTAQAP